MRRVIVMLMAILLAGCGTAGIVTPPSLPFPYPAGTVWTYMHIQGASQFVTTMTYQGEHTYRGMSLHRVDETSTLLTGLTTQSFFQWTNCPEYRAIVYIDQTGQTEIIFGQTWSIVCGINRSGSAEVYVNGSLVAHAPWSVSSSDGGLWSVTVPSGTYTTRRWNYTRVGAGNNDFGAAYVGANKVLIRNDGNNEEAYTLLLTSGPASSVTSAPSSPPVRLQNSTQGLSVVSGAPTIGFINWDVRKPRR